MRIAGSVLLLMFFLLAGRSANAQEREAPQPPTANASNIHIEFFGPGYIYSINYDGRFGKKDRGLGFRIGAGGAYADGEGFFAVPVGLNYLLGSNGNYFEMGAGTTITNLNDVIDFSDNRETNVNGFLSFGYRRQAFRKKGVLFRASFTPIFGDGFFIPFAGVGIGFRF